MKRDSMKLAAISSILIIFAPMGLSSSGYSAPRQAVLENTFVSSAPDDTQELQIQVLEEEAVGNWSVDENFHSRTDWGGLWVGVDSEAHLARSLVKFDLSHIRQSSAIASAQLCAYMSGALGLEDVPIGVFFAADDEWSETSVTWANQPSHSATPESVIDSPSSPEMFVMGNWYTWDITEAVLSTIEEDKTLSLVLKLTDELCPAPRGAVFAEDEYYHFNASYISLLANRPTVQDLAVNGNSDGLNIDYLQDPGPLLSWQSSDLDFLDHQSDFEVIVSDELNLDGSSLWRASHTDPVSLMSNCTSTTTYPFSVSNEVRIQYKYLSSLWNTSGIVDVVRFEVDTNETEVIFESLVLTLARTSLAGALGPSFIANYGTSRQVEVLRSSLYAARVVGGFIEFDVGDLFILSPDMNLIVELRYTNCSDNTALSRYTPGTGLGSVAYTWGPDAYVDDDAFFRYSYCFGMSLELSSYAPLAWNSSSPTTGIPFGLPSNSSGTVQLKLDKSLFSSPGEIGAVYFHANTTTQHSSLENLTITLAESYIDGALDNSNLETNYDSSTAEVVLEAPVFRLWNHGGCLALEFTSTFQYSGLGHLLIQVSWDCLEGSVGVFSTEASGGFAAWNFTGLGQESGNATWTPQMFLAYAHGETEVEYSGSPLPERDYVYWHLRVRDSLGQWSEWSVHSFRYYPFRTGPQFSGLSITPNPGVVSQEILIEIRVTFVLGVSHVLVAIQDSNRSMIPGVSDSYSYSWVPEEAGSVPFTIYMESAVGTWNVTSGWLYVEEGDTTAPPLGTGDILTLLVAGGVLFGAAAGAGILLKRRRPNRE